MSKKLRRSVLVLLSSAVIVLAGISVAYSQDSVMGQIHFYGSSQVVKGSGLWVDGQYVGYLGELRGGNKIRLLPGEHALMVRQIGFQDFEQKVMVEPRRVLDVHVIMDKDAHVQYPDRKTSSEVRLDVRPARAAVFLDDNFVGHVQEYYGSDRGMLVIPGRHRITIALSGYKAFETEVTLLPRQTFTLKTALLEGSVNDADPLIKLDRQSSARATPDAAQADVPSR